MQAALRASAGATVQNLTFNFFWEGIHLAVSTGFRSAPAGANGLCSIMKSRTTNGGGSTGGDEQRVGRLMTSFAGIKTPLILGTLVCRVIIVGLYF